MDAANYKHIVLGLIFLKYISDAFDAQREKLATRFTDPDDEFFLDPEDFADQTAFQTALAQELELRDYYLSDNIFWVSEKARWGNLKQVITLPSGSTLPWGDKLTSVSGLIDNAFDAIEREPGNEKLKGVIQRISGYQLKDEVLIRLFNLFSDTSFHRPTLDGKPLDLAAKDILGHVYEYFLGQFALAEGKKGGQYFTPKAIVSLIVELLEPYQGRIYDPAMGAGGFFVQSERFIEQHAAQQHYDPQQQKSKISIYGQESNPTTWKLAAMNMVIRGLQFNFGKHNADSFSDNQHPDLRADFIMANPPFNIKDWWSESLAHDPRWQYGTPPKGNANFAWLQHMIHHLAPQGRMALLLANGSMSSNTNNEGEIRQAILNADLVETMIALPGQLFTNTQIPACIWILNKAKARRGEVLFIDARNIGYMKDRTQRDFSAEDIQHIVSTYQAWQQMLDYQNVAGFCYSADLAEIAKNDYVLTPGRYVGAEAQQDDGIPFAEKMQTLTALLNQQFAESAVLEAKIKANLEGLGYE